MNRNCKLPVVKILALTRTFSYKYLTESEKLKLAEALDANDQLTKVFKR